MKIVVMMKQVANKDAILRINKEGTWIEEGDLTFEVNESDGYALEEALRLKDKRGAGEVVVCSMGPARVKSVIKDALARGADRAIHVTARVAPLSSRAPALPSPPQSSRPSRKARSASTTPRARLSAMARPSSATGSAKTWPVVTTWIPRSNSTS